MNFQLQRNGSYFLAENYLMNKTNQIKSQGIFQQNFKRCTKS